jgi:hypothetical protein
MTNFTDNAVKKILLSRPFVLRFDPLLPDGKFAGAGLVVIEVGHDQS